MEHVGSLRFSQQPITDTYPGLGGISSKPDLNLFNSCSSTMSVSPKQDFRILY